MDRRKWISSLEKSVHLWTGNNLGYSTLAGALVTGKRGSQQVLEGILALVYPDGFR